MIDGLILTPLKIIRDERGAVMHMLRADTPHFHGFGEIYFSIVNPGVTKGWKVHTKNWSNLAVPEGALRWVLYDAREDSPTKGEFMDCTLGVDNYQLMTVPPGIAYSFQHTSSVPVLVANCATAVHDPAEQRMLPLETYPFDWKK
jgi:dTDP-4-dehydrorhamnose 3,5-epimerase